MDTRQGEQRKWCIKFVPRISTEIGAQTLYILGATAWPKQFTISIDKTDKGLAKGKYYPHIFQKNQVTCLRSHRDSVAEPGIEPRSAQSQSGVRTSRYYWDMSQQRMKSRMLPSLKPLRSLMPDICAESLRWVWLQHLAWKVKWVQTPSQLFLCSVNVNNTYSVLHNHLIQTLHF